MGKTNFKFIGSNHTCRCENKEPHIPHIIGSYNTVHYGELFNFCQGIEGNGIKINISKNIKGSAGFAARLEGTYSV